MHRSMLSLVLVATCVVAFQHPFTVQAAASSSSSALASTVDADVPQWSENGYVMFCPCMGRLGNQLDHLLGTIDFIRQLNRTMIAPHLISFQDPPRFGRDFPAYSQLFNLSLLRQYLPVIEQSVFLKHFMNDEYWTPEKRIAFCYHSGDSKHVCEMRRGEPSTDYWTTTCNNVQFTSSQHFAAEGFSPEHWRARWGSGAEFPVITLQGAPARFPVLQEHKHLQRYVDLNDEHSAAVEEFIARKLPRPYLAIHLRHGSDWARSCESAVGQTYEYMESSQCMAPNEAIPQQVCLPTDDQVLWQIELAALQHDVRSIFVASDDHSKGLVDKIRHHMRAVAKARRQQQQTAEGSVSSNPKSAAIVVRQWTPNSAIADLGVMSRADHFIGNCVSSFTGFVARAREFHTTSPEADQHRSTAFWGRNDSSVTRSDLIARIEQRDKDVKAAEAKRKKQEKAAKKAERKAAKAKKKRKQKNVEFESSPHSEL